MPRPETSEYSKAMSRYIDYVPEEDVCAVLASQMEPTRLLIESIGEERSAFRYAPDKWSIKQVVGHFTDTERVFSYRAAAIARGEQQPLPGFDENAYVANAGFEHVALSDLLESYLAVRRATLLMLRQLPPEAWPRCGTASGNPVTVRAYAYAIVGHERHHLKILRERYLGGERVASSE
jgi:DinB superfamily